MDGKWVEIIVSILVLTELIRVTYYMHGKVYTESTNDDELMKCTGCYKWFFIKNMIVVTHPFAAGPGPHYRCEKCLHELKISSCKTTLNLLIANEGEES